MNFFKILAAGRAVIEAIAQLETGGTVDFRVGSKQYELKELA